MTEHQGVPACRDDFKHTAANAHGFRTAKSQRTPSPAFVFRGLRRRQLSDNCRPLAIGFRRSPCTFHDAQIARFVIPPLREKPSARGFYEMAFRMS